MQGSCFSRQRWKVFFSHKAVKSATCTSKDKLCLRNLRLWLWKWVICQSHQLQNKFIAHQLWLFRSLFQSYLWPKISKPGEVFGASSHSWGIFWHKDYSWSFWPLKSNLVFEAEELPSSAIPFWSKIFTAVAQSFHDWLAAECFRMFFDSLLITKVKIKLLVAHFCHWSEYEVYSINPSCGHWHLISKNLWPAI